ncbi:MAG TPA: RNA 2',3'-cyclic phosphodiesterase [Vicinamibacterales bacterium]|nr:RNA 2',3'-cyclic phosphodiesterase [Vicinamibacterales bacterium]
MRLFIAADLPDSVRDALAAEQKRLSAALAGSGSSLTWVRPEHAHLTLVFIGNVDDARVQAVADAIAVDVEAPPFEAVFEGAGVFPPRGAPRVLWIGVTAGAGELSHLQRILAARIAALRLPIEDRAFHPHLTLARWRESRSADRERALAAARRRVVARARISAATLYQSRLSPAGPTYTALSRANLTESRT